jgi:hypothetical protein
MFAVKATVLIPPCQHGDGYFRLPMSRFADRAKELREFTAPRGQAPYFLVSAWVSHVLNAWVITSVIARHYALL